MVKGYIRKGYFSIAKVNSKDLVFQFAEEFSERCLYIAINATVKKKDDLSGKFCFHSMYNNVGVYIRESEQLTTAFLVYIKGSWYIQSHRRNTSFLWEKAGGYFRLDTKETNPLLLSNEWEEGEDNNGWNFSAKIKIFNNEEDYNNYTNTGDIWAPLIFSDLS